MRRLQVIALIVLSAVAMRCGGPPAPPTIASFKATPESIIRGKGPVNLSWEVYGSPDTVIITGMEPILRAEGDTMIVGNTNVNPSQTTTYRLYASNEGGAVEQSVTVTVKDPPPPPPPPPPPVSSE
ncbi:MAG: hypothetical protein NZM06_06840 [Chloroherpetonaceae bacterium]|nr:hypothetical protein [Chloroherpetonaceae bacterium]